MTKKVKFLAEAPCDNKIIGILQTGERIFRAKTTLRLWQG
jgi:hypothetical protein